MKGISQGSKRHLASWHIWWAGAVVVWSKAIRHMAWAEATLLNDGLEGATDSAGNEVILEMQVVGCIDFEVDETSL